MWKLSKKNNNVENDNRQVVDEYYYYPMKNRKLMINYILDHFKNEVTYGVSLFIYGS